MPSPGKKKLQADVAFFYEGFSEEGFQADQMVYSSPFFLESCLHVGY